MASIEMQHRRTHNSLLISRILSCRDQISPFTLVLDSLHQSGWPLLLEMMTRARAAKVNVILVSFETLRKPAEADVFLRCHGKRDSAIQKEIASKVQNDKKTLVVFDSLHPLFAQDSFNPTPFLSALTTPTTSMLAIFHTSVPLATSFTTYTPPPLSMLRYLATAILTVHSLNHIITKKRALDRSEAPPLLGLEEGLDGAVLALGSNDPLGSVIEMEHRRRSGRSVVEWFYVPHAGKREPIVLLEDHPAYPRAAQDANASGDAVVSGTTFELGLSEAQRREREKVVLPYFDAQSEGGVGQGGRILYDLGAEDDFDEEEDEI